MTDMRGVENLGTPQAHTGGDGKGNIVEKNLHIPSFWVPQSSTALFAFQLQQVQGREYLLLSMP